MEYRTDIDLEVEHDLLEGLANFDIEWTESFDSDIGGIDGWEVESCKFDYLVTWGGQRYDRRFIIDFIGKDAVESWEKAAMESVIND